MGRPRNVPLSACSGPLPKATNATAPFFRDLWYFNASFNNLSGPIPEDFSRALIFNASAGFSWAAGFLGRAEALAVARQFAFDVSNNSLSGDLPGFLASSRLPKYLNASSLQLKVGPLPHQRRLDSQRRSFSTLVSQRLKSAHNSGQSLSCAPACLVIVAPGVVLASPCVATLTASWATHQCLKQGGCHETPRHTHASSMPGPGQQRPAFHCSVQGALCSSGCHIVQGNHFSCSSAQDKGYLNLTSCAQAAGSAQA